MHGVSAIGRRQGCCANATAPFKATIATGIAAADAARRKHPKTGNSSYINDIFLNNLAGACSEIIVFGLFSTMLRANEGIVWRFRGA